MTLRAGAWRIGERFGLRTPGLPLATLTRDLPAAANIGAWVEVLLRRPEVREAIFVASADLYAGLQALGADTDVDRRESTLRSLYRYLARMAARPTPFGLFAGVAIGRFGDATHLEVATAATAGRKTRLDNDYIFELCTALRRDPAIAVALRYRPSTSLCIAGGRLRYVEARTAGRRRSYELVAATPSPTLMAVLEHARGGAPHPELCLFVANHACVSVEAATEYVESLIDAQLLVAELQPAVTGAEPLAQLIDDLAPIPAAASIAQVLREVERMLAALDQGGACGEIEAYRRVAARLRALPAPVDPRRLFQVDVIKHPSNPRLHRRIATEIAEAVLVLARITPRQPTALDRFCEAFAQRYETREVPLAIALDEESGIGFDALRDPTTQASPLVAGLQLGGRAAEPMVPWEARDTYLADLVAAARGAGSCEIALREDDLRALTPTRPVALPNSLGALVTVLAADAAEVDAGRHRLVLHGADGPNGARFMGRFCQADPEIDAMVREHLAREQATRPDAVFAEIVHLPNGRTGNVLCRPVLRDHEISFLGRSGAASAGQIEIDDLWLRLDGPRLVLRSRRLGREIIPCMTNAHSGNGGLGTYRFLLALSRQGSQGVAWSWRALAQAEVLPRVTWQNVVLSRAKWNLGRRRIAALRGADDLAALRRELGMPRFVALAEHDNELPFDLDHEFARDALLRSIRGEDGCTLVELLPRDDELVARGTDGGYTHELVVTLDREVAAPTGPGPRRLRPAQPALRRRFGPGSEWLYARISCGAASADRVLTEAIEPLCRGALAAHPLFFVRYGDPSWHLRVRIHGEPSTLMRHVAPALWDALAPLERDGTIASVEQCTYEREVERYGGPRGIELCEQIACIDSRATLALLAGLDGATLADARWRLAVAGAHGLLEAFGIPRTERVAMMTFSRDGLGREFGLDGSSGTQMRKQLGQRHRALRGDLSDLLGAGLGPEHPLATSARILTERNAHLRPTCGALVQRARDHELDTPLPSVVLSLVHLHINRVLRSAHRAQELVIYDLLRRHYLGKDAP